ncbi:MAG: ABC transporter permease subunit [Leptospiraceae bacterium]|nr:ABC transporter permease subunit [Leptospiraceae bacterium]
MKSLSRIFTIFALTYRESIRRRLVLIFVGSCVIFSVAGAGMAKLISSTVSVGDPPKLLPKEQHLDQARAYYKSRGASGKQLDEIMARVEMQYDADAAAQTPEAIVERKQKASQSAEVIIISFCFGLFAFWSYLLAALFTPFIALNDLYTGSHVLLLSGPLQRWEYLSGKVLAILAMVVSSLILMLVTFHLGMLGLYGHPGWVIWKGVGLLVFGLALFISMLIFFSFTLGRMPAVLLSLAILFLAFIPAYGLLTEMTAESGFMRGILYMGYGLPQYGVNLMTAGLYTISGYEIISDSLARANLDLNKIGSNFQYISMVMNAAWLLLFGGLSLWLFQKREI